MLDGAGAGAELAVGVIGARCVNLALLIGGENLERLVIGMWFGWGLKAEFSRSRGGDW